MPIILFLDAKAHANMLRFLSIRCPQSYLIHLNNINKFNNYYYDAVAENE